MISPNFFNTIFVIPILNILVVFYKLFLTISLPGALGFAIIGLTSAVRGVLHPLSKKQMESAKKMQDLKPRLDALKKKHEKDPKGLQQAQLKLYQEAGINPAAGCLPLLVQIPFFIALFTTMNLFLSNGGGAKVIAGINKVLYFPILHIDRIDPWFFGLNLALSPQKGGNPIYFIVPVITVLLSIWQFRASQPAAPKEDIKGTTGDDFQRAMNVQMKYILPLMFGYFSYTWPVGLSLYWNIFSIFTIIQYKKIQK